MSSTLLADFRFGCFNYNVNVLPFDFGTTPAADAGIPGLNLDSTFTSGTAGVLHRAATATAALHLRLGPRRSRQPLQLPARPGREAVPAGRQRHQAAPAATRFKFGVDVRRAYNLRVPSDRHRSGELTFTRRPHARARRRRPRRSPASCSATSARFGRYVSPSTRRARAPVAPLLLRAGYVARQLEADAQLRPAARRHQPADRQRAGQRRLPRPRHRRDSRRRRRRHRPQRRRREHASTGRRASALTYQIDAEDGDPRRLRPQLRHRRLRLALRPQRDPEPAGAVDPAAQRAGELRPRLQPGQRPAAAGLPRRAGDRASSRCRTASSPARCRRSSGRRTSTPSTSPSSAS